MKNNSQPKKASARKARFLRPRNFVFLAVAVVFALSGLMGGAFATSIYQVNASSGQHNEVTANYSITGLPKQTVLKGSTIASQGIPTMTGGHVALYRMSNTRPLKVETTGNYEYLGPYEWRFFIEANDITDNPNNYIHRHEVTVTQENYTISVPTSAQYETDGTINFVPNVSIPHLDITLPMPDKFVDKKGNDLFDDSVKNIKKLRQDVLDGWTHGVTFDEGVATDLDNFKKIIYSNTQIFFYGVYSDGYDDCEDGSRLVINEADRTFTPPAQGNYYAEYKFGGKTGNTHPRISATYTTSTIAVEYPGLEKNAVLGLDSNGDPDAKIAKEKQIRFDAPPSTSSLSSSSLVINQEIQLPLPTVSLISGTSTDPDDDTYQPVKLSASSVTGYTYITVEHWTTAMVKTTTYDTVRIDEKSGYKFTPTLPGYYSFLYHTTTIYGAGYTGHFKSGEGLDAISTANGFIQYYPHDRFLISTNTVRPEIKWSVPYNYITKDDIKAAATLAGVNVNDSTALAEFTASYKYKEGDAVAEEEYISVFGIENEGILERYGDKDYFTDAPSLDYYMPNNNTAAAIQISGVNGEEALVLPALLGFNNVDSGSKLIYTIKLSRWENGSKQEEITFRSNYSFPTTIPDKPTTFPYDHTQPLVIGFDDNQNGTRVGDEYTDYSKTNGYGSGGYLSTWRGKSKAGEYRLEVLVTDNSNSSEHFGSGSPTSSLPTYYSFTVVNEADPMKTANPEFPIGGLKLTQTYYEDDTITFSKIGVSDKYTQNVKVDYYLIWDDGGANTDTFVKLNDEYIQGDTTVVFELSKKDPEVAKIFRDLTDGVLDINVVAVAKNYYALAESAHSAQGYFLGNTNEFGIDDLRDYLDNNYAGDMNGITVVSHPIKVYDQTSYGSPAVIGFHDGTNAIDGDAMKSYWKGLYGTGNDIYGWDSDVYQGTEGGVKFPTFTVGYNYNATAEEYMTTVEFQMLLPVRREATAVNGGTTQILPIQKDVLDDNGTPGDTSDDTITRNYQKIEGLYFYPEEIGIHTLVCRVYNGGGYVSVFTAQINVVGSPTTVPELIGGETTGKVGQTITLPTAVLTIDGKPFTTKNNAIYADYTPDYVMVGGVKTKYNAALHQDYLKVGSYSIVASAVGNVPVPTGQFGGYFIPAAEGKYTLVYNLKINNHKLNDLCISSDTTYDDYTVSVKRDIVVTGISEENGFKVNLLGEYNTLPGADVSDGAGKITSSNIIPQMTSTGASSNITMGLSQLNNAMTISTYGEPSLNSSNEVVWSDDIYNFGRVYLPNMYAEWQELSSLYNFNLADASRVTVSHSKSTSDYIFDSKNIGAKTNPETKVVEATKNGGATELGEYYWFQPSGSVYVEKPQYDLVAVDESEWPALEAFGETLFWHEVNGYWYFKDVAGVYQGDANDWYYFDFTNGYADSDYKNKTKYGDGSRDNLVDKNISPDGIYTVTYTIQYGGITATKEYKISLGDTITPTIEFAADKDDDLFGEAYKLDSNFVINTNDFRVRPNGSRITELEASASDYNQTEDFFALWYVAKNMKVSVTRPGGSYQLQISSSEYSSSADDNYIYKTPVSDDDIYPKWLKGEAGDPNLDEWGYELDNNGKRITDSRYDAYKGNREWRFKLTETGDYTITFSITSESGQTAYLTRTITVEEPKPKSAISPQTVWGTILIVISAGLLIGIVVYFVQTGRKTKFAGTEKIKAKKAKGSPDGKPDKPDAVV